MNHKLVKRFRKLADIAWKSQTTRKIVNSTGECQHGPESKTTSGMEQWSTDFRIVNEYKKRSSFIMNPRLAHCRAKRIGRIKG